MDIPSKYRGHDIPEKPVQANLKSFSPPRILIRLKLPPNLYRPWKLLYRQQSKKRKDPPPPLTPLEHQLFDHAKVKFDQRMNFLQNLFAQERQSL